MASIPRAKARWAAAVSALAAAMFALAGSATAAGDSWGYISCPVDAPAMLAVPAGSPSSCVDLGGHSTNYNVGSKQSPGDYVDIGLGFPGPTDSTPPIVGNFYDSDTAFPVGPGSALPYIDFCSVYPFLSQSWKQCEIGGLPPGQLNGVEGTVDGVAYNLTLMTVSLRLAGTPSSPDVDALQHPGDPVITLPIKFQINGPGLGNTCSVGTESDPIMLHLKTITPPTDTTTDTDPNGYPVSFTTYWDGKIADSSFAEPGATGCGPGDLLDGVVNGLLGLPSAAGQNSFTMDHLVTAIASTTAGGEVLSQSFHAWQGF